MTIFSLTPIHHMSSPFKLSIDWSQCCSEFEAQFLKVFTKSKKAHFDNLPDPIRIIDGARRKWRFLLLLDALFYAVDAVGFNTNSRRAFNQHNIVSMIVISALAGEDKELFRIQAERAINGSNDVATFSPSDITVTGLTGIWLTEANFRLFHESDTPAKAKEKYLVIVDRMCKHAIFERFAFNFEILIQHAIFNIILLFVREKSHGLWNRATPYQYPSPTLLEEVLEAATTPSRKIIIPRLKGCIYYDAEGNADIVASPRDSPSNEETHDSEDEEGATIFMQKGGHPRTKSCDGVYELWGNENPRKRGHDEDGNYAPSRRGSRKKSKHAQGSPTEYVNKVYGALFAAANNQYLCDADGMPIVTCSGGGGGEGFFNSSEGRRNSSSSYLLHGVSSFYSHCDALLEPITSWSNLGDCLASSGDGGEDEDRMDISTVFEENPSDFFDERQRLFTNDDFMCDEQLRPLALPSAPSAPFPSPANTTTSTTSTTAATNGGGAITKSNFVHSPASSSSNNNHGRHTTETSNCDDDVADPLEIWRRHNIHL